MNIDKSGRARRRVLRSLSLAPIADGLVAGAAGLVPALTQNVLAATPACGTGAQPTPRQTEGPYFTRDSPLRRSLLQPAGGRAPLLLEGIVRTVDCAAVPGALLDFWQADEEGAYDNRGFRLRGHQFTDPDGRYRLETVLPGLYPGRTRHIHVKVQAPGGPVLTTQLYFPGEVANRDDGIFSPALLMSAAKRSAAPGGEQVQASFDFVIRLA
jgi:protocatechuate 3,4-dioxygenase beta subunit